MLFIFDYSAYYTAADAIGREVILIAFKRGINRIYHVYTTKKSTYPNRAVFILKNIMNGVLA
ncbi:hypothetical protein D3C85_968540 [compost metagenome]